MCFSLLSRRCYQFHLKYCFLTITLIRFWLFRCERIINCIANRGESKISFEIQKHWLRVRFEKFSQKIQCESLFIRKFIKTQNAVSYSTMNETEIIFRFTADKSSIQNKIYTSSIWKQKRKMKKEKTLSLIICDDVWSATMAQSFHFNTQKNKKQQKQLQWNRNTESHKN